MGAIDNMVKGAAGRAGSPEYEPDVWPSGNPGLKQGAVIPVIQGLKAVWLFSKETGGSSTNVRNNGDSDP